MNSVFILFSSNLYVYLHVNLHVQVNFPIDFILSSVADQPFIV